MDEHEKLEKIREIRLIVTEILMFLSVILLVGFLTLIVTGYSFNLREIGGEGEVVERTGLLQISSIPTGATIAIDGGTPLLLRTNGSKTTLAGEHEITLSKEGFDTWTRNVKVSEGLMYRVNYPRLFLIEREPEDVLAMKEVKFTTISPNKEKLVYLQNGKLFSVELNATAPNPKELTLPATFTEKIETITEIDWSGNSERLVVRVNGRLAVINVKTPLESLFLSEVVDDAVKIMDLKIESEAGERLLVLTDRNEILEVNLRDKEVSEPLLKNVIKFDNDGERIAFLTCELEKTEEGEEKERFYLKAYRIGEEQSYKVRLVPNADAKIVTMKYFQDTYFGVTSGKNLKVYMSASWPVADDAAEKIFDGEFGFDIATLKKRGKGMVLSVRDAENKKQGGFDLEALEKYEFETEGMNGWIDEFLCFEIDVNGKLTVRDFDGLNTRILVSGGVQAEKPVIISGNNRYMYYFSNGKLIREKIN